jgi:CRP/FNR family cyclic AMP-dependent transcriptional regulator
MLRPFPSLDCSVNATQLLDHHLPLLKGVVRADLDGLNLAPKLLTLAAWQTLLHQGSDDRDVYFLLSGALLALHWSDDGKEVIFTRFRHGDLFGELAALDGGPRSLTVVARADATVLRLTQQDFLTLIDRVPLVRRRVLRSLCDRIRDLTRRNLAQVTQSADQRLRGYLLSFAIERGQLHPGASIGDVPTHAEIAATIGATREIVSRNLSELRRQGVIRTGRGRIDLLDPSALSTACD